MIKPNRRTIAKFALRHGISQATHFHPQPRFFKYRWQIYTADSPWENDDFFAHSPRLCTHNAMQLLDALAQACETFIVYNERLPRRGPGTPFDPQSPRWIGYEFACAYDADPDPVWNGFK